MSEATDTKPMLMANKPVSPIDVSTTPTSPASDSESVVRSVLAELAAERDERHNAELTVQQHLLQQVEAFERILQRVELEQQSKLLRLLRSVMQPLADTALSTSLTSSNAGSTAAADLPQLLARIHAAETRANTLTQSLQRSIRAQYYWQRAPWWAMLAIYFWMSLL